MGSIQWFLQLLIFYLFCLYFLVAFDISSSAIWGDHTADRPFCVLLYRTYWRPIHPLWNDGAFFTFSLASKRLCSLVLFPGASKDCPSLFSLFLAAVWFWASLVILWLPLADLPFEGYVDKPSFPEVKPWLLLAIHLFLSTRVKMLILLFTAKRFIMQKHENCLWIRKDRALLRIPRYKRSYLFPCRSEFLLVTGYVGICLEPACSGDVVILGMDM